MKLRYSNGSSINSVSDLIDDFRIKYASEHLINFIKYTKDGYIVKWYHENVCSELEKFLFTPGDNRLMVFMPPQHGKSEIVSRRMPAFAFGKNPDLQIVNCSYAFKLASKMNRDVQRIMAGPRYNEIFPGVGIRSMGIRNYTGKSVIRRQDEFEIIGHEGRYMSVGIMGGLTGTPVDILIIDDPVKDPLQAFSKLMRDRLWDWFEAVADTRLHNSSKILLTMTRWHEDDLAGRLIKKMKEEGGEKWRIIRFPALRESYDDPNDIRVIGEALWEEKHSKEKLDRISNTSKRLFISLYQQRPAAEEGVIFKKEWFKTFTRFQLDEMEVHFKAQAIWHYVTDTAYEDKERDDPSAFLAYTFFNHNLYILEVSRVFYEMPQLIKFSIEFARRNNYSSVSTFKVEPKASGKSLVQMLKSTTNLNVSEGVVPAKDKVARANVCVPFVESGRVYLLEGASWVQMFIDEVCLFPNAPHDDIVDCFTMAVSKVMEPEKGHQIWKG